MYRVYNFNFIHSLRKLGTLFFVRDGDHNKFPDEHRATENSGIRYIRSQDIKEGLILNEKPVFVSEEYFDTIKRSHIRPGDVLFSIMATIGGVAVVPTDYSISTANRAVGILEPKTKGKIIPDYLVALFNTEVGMHLLEVQKRGGVQQRLNLDDIYHLKIPLPDIDHQGIVIRDFNGALNRKRQQEAQAQGLLDSIDGYLLGELGITLPPEPENTIQNRMFNTSWRQVSGGRFDPTFHQGNIYGPVANTQHRMIPLRKLVQYFKTGFAAGRGDQDLEGSGIIQIRPTNMNSSRELIFDKNVRISPAENEDYSNDLLVPGEVLFNNTNSQELVGKTVYFNLADDYFCSNHITRVKTNEQLNSEYLTHLFNLYQRQQVFFKSCINWNNQSGINVDILRSVLIPTPSVDIQKRIAEQINDIRQQAQHLRQQAQREFAEAKQEIERLILG